MAPVSQLSDVQKARHGRGVRFWVEKEAISVNGAPAIAVVNLGRGADARAIQAILDSLKHIAA